MMDVETVIKNPEQPKPQNMLLLQQSMLESRIFPVFTLQQALEKMIKIYSQATTIMNYDNSGNEDIVRFSLKSMIEYFSNMENIMFMQKDNLLNANKSNQKHKSQLLSYDKQFVLGSLRIYCVKKSVESSIEIARQAFKNGQDIEEVLKNMGFSQ